MRVRSRSVCPSDPFDCHCQPPCYSAAGQQSRRFHREQHDRRVGQFGPKIVAEMEAKVDAMMAIDAGLTRDNVLSLMEGMYSTSGDALARELIQLIKRLALDPGTRIMIAERVAGIERELDAR